MGASHTKEGLEYGGREFKSRSLHLKPETKLREERELCYGQKLPQTWSYLTVPLTHAISVKTETTKELYTDPGIREHSPLPPCCRIGKKTLTDSPRARKVCRIQCPYEHPWRGHTTSSQHYRDYLNLKVGPQLYWRSSRRRRAAGSWRKWPTNTINKLQLRTASARPWRRCLTTSRAPQCS